MMLIPPTNATVPSIAASLRCMRRNRRMRLRLRVKGDISRLNQCTSTPDLRNSSTNEAGSSAEPNPSSSTRTVTPRSAARRSAWPTS